MENYDYKDALKNEQKMWPNKIHNFKAHSKQKCDNKNVFKTKMKAAKERRQNKGRKN